MRDARAWFVDALAKDDSVSLKFPCLRVRSSRRDDEVRRVVKDMVEFTKLRSQTARAWLIVHGVGEAAVLVSKMMPKLQGFKTIVFY